MTGQKKLKDDYKDPDMLPKINKSDMAGMMEAIKKYIWSHPGVVRTPLAYIIRKIITVQTYGDYPIYATPDDEIIARYYTCPQTRTRCTISKMHSQLLCVQQRTNYITGQSMTLWIRSAKIQICIHPFILGD